MLTWDLGWEGSPCPISSTWCGKWEAGVWGWGGWSPERSGFYISQEQLPWGNAAPSMWNCKNWSSCSAFIQRCWYSCFLCPCGGGGHPPHQGWSIRLQVPALCLSRLNRQLDVAKRKFCVQGELGFQTHLDMSRVQQKLSEMQFWAGVKCKHHVCLSPFVLSKQSPSFFSGWVFGLFWLLWSLLGWCVPLAKHALNAPWCIARRALS